MEPRCRGNVLLITLFILTLAAALVGTVLSTTMTGAKNADRSRNYQAAQAAAEGAVDFAYAIWLKRISNKHNLLSSAADLSVSGPSFSGTSAPPGTSGYAYFCGSSGSDGWLRIQALDKYGVPLATGSTPDPVIGPVPGYPGWWGQTYTYAATAILRPAASAAIEGNTTLRANFEAGTFRVGVRRLFQYTAVSLFQTMYFFQHDLEIYNPATIELTGLIHTNAALYLSVKDSSDLKIDGKVSTAGKLPSGYTPDFASVPGYSTAEPPLAKGSNYDLGTLADPTWNGGGAAAQLHEVAPIQPLGPQLEADFTNPAYASNPNVTGGYHELIEPPNPSYTDLPEIAQRRLYNQAGLIIKISGTNRSGSASGGVKQYSAADIAITTATVDSKTSDVTLAPVSGKTVLVAALQGATLPTNPASSDYTAAVNAMIPVINKKLHSDSTPLFDQRVGANVDVANLDVGNLDTFIYKNISGNFNGVVYVQDTTADGTFYNTVRISNADALPSNSDLKYLQAKGLANSSLSAVCDGLTIASPNPVYIMGDFNTGTSPKSSTLSAPTVTSAPTGSSPVQGASIPYTRLPAAVIADAITLLSNAWTDANSPTYSKRDASNTTYNVALLGGYMPSVSGYYSGGAVNYPRYLEDWTDKYCTYWGSMVELFPSTIFTQRWQTPDTYYHPPTRYFNFDPNYLRTTPPGSVCAIVLSRGAYSKF